jgi:hypothetical protein
MYVCMWSDGMGSYLPQEHVVVPQNYVHTYVHVQIQIEMHYHFWAQAIDLSTDKVKREIRKILAFVEKKIGRIFFERVSSKVLEQIMGCM